MGYLENLEYKKRILYDTFTISTGQANLYFSKHKNPTDVEGGQILFSSLRGERRNSRRVPLFLYEFEGKRNKVYRPFY